MEEKRFRYAFGPLFTTMVLTWGIPCILWQIFVPDEYYSGAVLAALTFPFVFGMIALYPVVLSDEGLRCHNFYGINRTIKWEDIARVKPIKIVTVKYLRVFPKQGRPLWLPLQTTGGEALFEHIKTQAPESPLKAHFA